MTATILLEATVLRSVLVSFAFVPLVAGAEARGQHPTADPSQTGDSATIAGLEQRVEAAVVRRDAAFLDSVYAPTFRFKHSTGELETRAQLISSLRAPEPPDAPGRTISRDIDSVEVEVHGNVALTTGRIHVVRDGGSRRWRNYTIRYVRIYARSALGAPWMLITHHSTSDAQGAPPARARPGIHFTGTAVAGQGGLIPVGMLLLCMLGALVITNVAWLVFMVRKR